MASKDNRIYRSKSPWKTAVIAALVLVFVILLVIVIIFFSFQKYIVYTSDGVRLDVPWLEETVEQEAYQTPQEEA